MVDVGFSEIPETDLYIGKQIDDYKILKEIGRGGMGTVYLAARADESYDKKVAVKLIKRGMDTAAVLKRFVMERKILAQFDNPNIACLLDGGSTVDGLPYLVMEYIEGLPVTKFCELHCFDITEKLELFQKVCAAVSYAHQNLIVHRDLKPSNILVTESGEPKLLDFGIAKLLIPDWSLDTAEATATMFRIMTPDYASPEQFRGLPTTTASDVYSLGVVLYELLTGVRPFKIESKFPIEVENIVLSEVPVRPSTVISRPASRIVETSRKENYKTDIGRNRKSNISNRKSLVGDLDNIILKALRKEPERRYQSVQEFSEDIRRHLGGLPVAATPDTRRYRINKFIGRHRAGVFAGCLIFLTLVCATAVTTWQSVVANRERARAERQFSETRKLANSLLFEIHDSLSDLPGATSSRELLVARALQYLEALSRESSNNREVLMELSLAYRKVGDIQGNPFGANTGNAAGAEKSYRASLTIQEKLLSESLDDLNVQEQILTTTVQLANNLFSQGKYLDAKNNFKRAITIANNVIESEPANLLAYNSLAHVYLRMEWLSASVTSDEDSSDFAELAWKATEKALELNPNDQDALINAADIYSGKGNNLGNPEYNDVGKPSDAVIYLNKSLEFRQKLFKLSPESNRVQNLLAVGYRDMGEVLLVLGKTGDSLDYFHKALAIHQNLAQKDPKNAFAQGNVGLDLLKLAGALVKKGELEEAFQRSGESLTILGAMHSKDESSMMAAHSFAMSLEKHGDVLIAKKQAQEAVSYFRRSLVIEKELNSREANFEFELRVAQLHLKIGNVIMRQRPFNTRNSQLKSRSAREFEESVKYFNLAAKRKVLGPSNSALLRKAVATLNARNG